MKYKCNSYLDSYEYGKMALVFSTKMWISFSIYGSLYNLIFSLVIFLLSKNIIDAITLFLIIEVIMLILFRLELRNVSKFFYKIYLSKKVESFFTIEFYQEYFKQIGNTILEEKYNDIDRCIETDTNFYLIDNKKGIIFVLEKNELEFELVKFLRKKFTNIENQLGGKINFKNKG